MHRVKSRTWPKIRRRHRLSGDPDHREEDLDSHRTVEYEVHSLRNKALAPDPEEARSDGGAVRPRGDPEGSPNTVPVHRSTVSAWSAACRTALRFTCRGRTARSDSQEGYQKRWRRSAASYRCDGAGRSTARPPDRCNRLLGGVCSSVAQSGSARPRASSVASSSSASSASVRARMRDCSARFGIALSWNASATESSGGPASDAAMTAVPARRARLASLGVLRTERGGPLIEAGLGEFGIFLSSDGSDSGEIPAARIGPAQDDHSNALTLSQGQRLGRPEPALLVGRFDQLYVGSLPRRQGKVSSAAAVTRRVLCAIPPGASWGAYPRWTLPTQPA